MESALPSPERESPDSFFWMRTPLASGGHVSRAGEHRSPAEEHPSRAGEHFSPAEEHGSRDEEHLSQAEEHLSRTKVAFIRRRAAKPRNGSRPESVASVSPIGVVCG